LLQSGAIAISVFQQGQGFQTMRKTPFFGRSRAGFALCTLLGLGLLVLAAPARAQTPSPLAEWQYSSGIQLQRLFEPSIPTWQTELGLGAQFNPIYDGAGRYSTTPGPVIDIRYKDIAFASTGEGIGANLFSFRHVRFGIWTANRCPISAPSTRPRKSRSLQITRWPNGCRSISASMAASSSAPPTAISAMSAPICRCPAAARNSPGSPAPRSRSRITAT
jgi:hypothetical protein